MGSRLIYAGVCILYVRSGGLFNADRSATKHIETWCMRLRDRLRVASGLRYIKMKHDNSSAVEGEIHRAAEHSAKIRGSIQIIEGIR